MTQTHTAVAIIIIRDNDGNFFVHRRNKSKKLFPGKYGPGAGGRLEPAISYKEGLIYIPC